MSPQLGKFMKIDTLVENLEVDFLSLFFFWVHCKWKYQYFPTWVHSQVQMGDD